MSEDLCFTPASELASRIRRRDLSPVEVVDAFLERIEDRNGRINAYVTVLDEEARKKARESERLLGSGRPLGSLHGVPVAIKDLFDFKAGVRNTFGSKLLAGFVPRQSVTYVQRLEAAGAIVLGKTNTPEFGHKGATDNLLFGPTSTPFAPGKNAGGSSGGSAAAVADGLAAIAQGTDSGGSIRIPASFCGVYGLKASFGRVATASRPDAFVTHTPFSHSGPLSRTVEDAALMVDVMAGPHPRDPFSLPYDGTDYLAATRQSVEGLSVAYSPDFGVFPVDERIGTMVGRAVRAFEEAGAHVEEVGVKMKRAQQELSELWLREMGIRYADFLGGLKEEGLDLLSEHRDELTPQFVELLESAQGMSAVEYKRDDMARTEVFDAIQDVFDGYDLLVTPTLAVPPFDNADDGNTLGPTKVAGEEVNPLLGWCLTYPINFTGHPSASVPCGFVDEGLPVGMQIVGRRYADDVVLAASAAFERIRPWHGSYPPR
ncbi:MAG: amidase family protein [Actinomycetota bacterium]|nr:amidase family protein [Actinomycetota bacterium]